LTFKHYFDTIFPSFFILKGGTIMKKKVLLLSTLMLVVTGSLLMFKPMSFFKQDEEMNVKGVAAVTQELVHLNFASLEASPDPLSAVAINKLIGDNTSAMKMVSGLVYHEGVVTMEDGALGVDGFIVLGTVTPVSKVVLHGDNLSAVTILGASRVERDGAYEFVYSTSEIILEIETNGKALISRLDLEGCAYSLYSPSATWRQVGSQVNGAFGTPLLPNNALVALENNLNIIANENQGAMYLMAMEGLSSAEVLYNIMLECGYVSNGFNQYGEPLLINENYLQICFSLSEYYGLPEGHIVLEITLETPTTLVPVAISDINTEVTSRLAALYGTNGAPAFALDLNLIPETVTAQIGDGSVTPQYTGKKNTVQLILENIDGPTATAILQAILDAATAASQDMLMLGADLLSLGYSVPNPGSFYYVTSSLIGNVVLYSHRMPFYLAGSDSDFFLGIHATYENNTLVLQVYEHNFFA
jgi:hypothetical protein